MQLLFVLPKRGGRDGYCMPPTTPWKPGGQEMGLHYQCKPSLSPTLAQSESWMDRACEAIRQICQGSYHLSSLLLPLALIAIFFFFAVVRERPFLIHAFENIRLFQGGRWSRWLDPGENVSWRNALFVFLYRFVASCSSDLSLFEDWKSVDGERNNKVM